MMQEACAVWESRQASWWNVKYTKSAQMAAAKILDINQIKLGDAN